MSESKGIECSLDSIRNSETVKRHLFYDLPPCQFSPLVASIRGNENKRGQDNRQQREGETLHCDAFAFMMIGLDGRESIEIGCTTAVDVVTPLDV